MRYFLRIFSVVICLVFLLASCSMVRLSYSQGPHLARWWLDRYANFSHEQEPLVKDAIHQWFEWHRETQLSEYADWLARLRDQLNDSITPTQVCHWSEELRSILSPAIDYSLRLSVPIVVSLNKIQLHHIERRFSKNNDELRHNYLQSDLDTRLEASIKRTVKRIENFYGEIDKEQRALIKAGIVSSPFDPEVWFMEQKRNQRQVLMTIHELTSEPIKDESAITMLRTLAARFADSDDSNYRIYQAELMEYNCAFAARIHNSTHSRQRQYAFKKFRNWENDLRTLIASGH